MIKECSSSDFSSTALIKLGYICMSVHLFECHNLSNFVNLLYFSSMLLLTSNVVMLLDIIVLVITGFTEIYKPDLHACGWSLIYDQTNICSLVGSNLYHGCSSAFKVPISLAFVITF